MTNIIEVQKRDIDTKTLDIALLKEQLNSTQSELSDTEELLKSTQENLKQVCVKCSVV